MSDDSKKVSQVPQAANVSATDRVLVLRDPSGTPSVRTVNVSVLSANLVISNDVPAHFNSLGIAGTIRHDDTYLYICIDTNLWKRVLISTW
jgi:hypothetical protein